MLKRDGNPYGFPLLPKDQVGPGREEPWAYLTETDPVIRITCKGPLGPQVSTWGVMQVCWLMGLRIETRESMRKETFVSTTPPGYGRALS